MRRVLLSLFGTFVLLSAGCRGLSYERTFSIEKDLPYHETEFRADKKEQTVTVSADTDSPVNVYVLLSDDKPDAIAALQSGKNPRKTIAASQATKEAKLEGKIPAGQGFVVLIQPAEKGKEIEVKLSVHSK
jgi:hypothetical protein